MPRRNRHEKISRLDLDRIERQIGLLRIEMRNAQIGLKPFRDHYDALSELDGHLHTAINLLNDRPPDYRKAHGSTE